MSINITKPLLCGCIYYYYYPSYQLSGVDLCKIHQVIVNRMIQIAKGQSSETEPPNMKEYVIEEISKECSTIVVRSFG